MATLIDSSHGVRVALHDLGGDGPPLLMLHATGFHGRCYRAVAENLSDHFHVWAPDLRGHGDSVTPEGADFGWASMVDDVRAVSEHLGIESWAVAGHSMGGALAARTALTQPGLVSAAWVFEPVILPPVAASAEARGHSLAESARLRRHTFDSVDQAVERYSQAAPFALVSREVIRDYVVHGFFETGTGITLKTSGETEARVFEGVDLELFGQLGSVAAPFTVAASNDGGPPSSIAGQVADRLPDARRVVWPDNTHFGPLEDPQRAAEEILDAVLESRG